MSKKTTLIVEASLLDAALVRINKSAQGLADAIQIVLASATVQAVQHGNTNWLNGLIEAAGKGTRKTAIAQWVLAHAPVVLESDKEKAKAQPFKFSKDRLEKLAAEHAEGEKFTGEEAMAYGEHVLSMHWTEHKEPPLVPEKFDLAAALTKLIKQADGYAKKGTKLVNADALGALRALAAPKAPAEEPST